MAIKEKVVAALVEALEAEYVRLEDDDGISGFAVARKFEGMSSLDRQGMIEKALGKALTQDEHRQVLMIAALTPSEHDAVGAPIRVHRIREMADGAIEVMLHGLLSDAEYVRGVLDHQQGVRTTVPRPVPGSPGLLVKFSAKGTESKPLTKEKVIRTLKDSRYVELAAKI